jgi:hypothetical protein
VLWFIHPGGGNRTTSGDVTRIKTGDLPVKPHLQPWLRSGNQGFFIDYVSWCGLYSKPLQKDTLERVGS